MDDMAPMDAIALDAETPQPATPERAALGRDFFLCLGLIAIVTLAVFSRCLTADFVRWDDNIHIYENPHFVLGAPGGAFSFFWHHAYEGLYVPLSYMVFGLLANASRLAQRTPSLTDTGALFNPHVFHAANAFFHVLNAVLVFIILRMLTRRDVPALLGALLFALHPVQVESVAWASELRGLLSGFFCLCAVACYVIHAQKTSWAAYSLGIALMVAALLSKPSAVTLPLMLFALDRWIIGRPLRGCLIGTLPMLLICVPFVWITRQAQPVPQEIVTPLWDRVFIAGDALAFYCEKLIFPFGLGIDYGRTPTAVLHHWTAFVTWLVPAALTVAVVRVRHRFSWLVGASLISLAALLPVLGLIPFVYQTYSTVADRYLYLAMLGPALALAFWLNALPESSPRRLVPVIAVLCAFALLTVFQTGTWANTVTLMSQALAVNPRSAVAYNNLGIVIANEPPSAQIDRAYQAAIRARSEIDTSGDPSDVNLANPAERAIALYREAIRLSPSLPTAHYDLGVELTDTGHASEAMQEFRTAIALKSDYAEPHASLANALMEQNQTTEAIGEYRTALAQNPNLGAAHFGLANALAQTGQPADAEREYRVAIGIDPSDASPYANLATLLMQEGRLPEAVDDYRAALKLKPDLEQAHYNLGYALLHENQPLDAAVEFQAALNLDPNSSDTHDQFGVSLAMSGNTQAAAYQFREAVRLDPHNQTAQSHLAMAEKQMHP